MGWKGVETNKTQGWRELSAELATRSQYNVGSCDRTSSVPIALPLWVSAQN